MLLSWETIPLNSWVMIFWLWGLLYALEKLPMLPVFWLFEMELSFWEGCSESLKSGTLLGIWGFSIWLCCWICWGAEPIATLGKQAVLGDKPVCFILRMRNGLWELPWEEEWESWVCWVCKAIAGKKVKSYVSVFLMGGTRGKFCWLTNELPP